jgi:[acyl-carrier-protein] S-malonyltransferase
MGKDFFDASPSAREVFDRANKVLGFDLASICFNGPEDRLNQTDISQPAIYVTSIAAYRAAAQHALITPEPTTIYAGLSLGEYTALHLAGVFTFEDGLKLVAARGRYMQDAAVASPSGMVALLGADEAAVKNLCEEAAKGEVLVPANYNSPGQIVVSGAVAACQRVGPLAESKGFKAIPLKVAGAFHSPLMQPAAEKMRLELEKVPFSPPQATVYSNVTAQPHTDTTTIKKLLVDQITQPVRWEQTMQPLASQPDIKFIELAPGRTLAGMLKKINRRLPIESFATAEPLPKSLS